MSIGISMCTGPGRLVMAMVKALDMTSGTSCWRSTRTDHLVTLRNILYKKSSLSTPWKVSLAEPRGTVPEMCIIGKAQV